MATPWDGWGGLALTQTFDAELLDEVVAVTVAVAVGALAFVGVAVEAAVVAVGDGGAVGVDVFATVAVGVEADAAQEDEMTKSMARPATAEVCVPPLLTLTCTFKLL